MLKPIKWYKKLHSVKGRIETGSFIVEGPRALYQIIQNYPASVQEILVEDHFDYKHKGECGPRIISSKQFSSISVNKTPQGVMGIVTLPEEYANSELPGVCGNKVLILEDVQDPGNVGTLLRTAVAFNFSGAILSNGCADPFSPKAIQSSAGAVLSLWLRRTSRFYEIVESLKEKQFILVSAHIGSSKPLNNVVSKKLALVMGNEGNGISKQMLSLSDNTFTIPINNDCVESLNVASAGAICMFLAGQKE